jgi:hypothetical protein
VLSNKVKNRGIRKKMTHLYPEKMLPTIGYHDLYSNDFTDLTHLEFEVMEDLRKMVEGVKTILSREALVQIAELYVAHLCAYLGFYTVSSLGIEKAKVLQRDIEDLLETQANASYDMFHNFPVRANANKSIIDNNITYLKKHTPGTLVVQTIRLGGTLWNCLTALGHNRKLHLGYSNVKQTELFCPVLDFLELSNTEASLSRRESRFPFLFSINQMTMQIAWLMGYFGHLDQKPPQMYIDYGKPLIEVYIESGDKYLTILKNKK